MSVAGTTVFVIDAELPGGTRASGGRPGRRGPKSHIGCPVAGAVSYP